MSGNTSIPNNDNDNDSEACKSSLIQEVQSMLDTIIASNDCSSETLRPEVQEFLAYLHKYFDTRQKMEQKYLELDPNQILETYIVETDSGGIEAESGNPNDFKQEYQQQSIKGESVTDIEELYTAAEMTLPFFKSKIEDIVEQVDKIDVGSIETKFLPLKARKRAEEKANDDYTKREPGPGVSWLYDIVRGSILCASMEQVTKVLDLMKNDHSIHIVKAKNRFENPTLSGYRDFNLVIRLDVDIKNTDQTFTHSCEIQIHLKELQNLSKDLNSHSYYEYFRSYFSGATASLKDRLADLEMISNGEELNEATMSELLETNEDEDRLDRLADLFEESVGEYNWALRVHSKLFEIRVTKYGSNHSTVADSYNKMANVLDDQGKLDEAMEFYQKSLAIRRKVFGDEQSEVADCYNNMALVLNNQGKLDEAMELYQKSLAICRNVFADEHSEVADCYNNMAEVLKNQGKLDEAMELHQKSLAISRKVYGDEHSKVAGCYNNMALVLNKQGKLDEAMEFYQKSLAIYRKVFGDEHSLVATCYNNMALVLNKQGKHDEAMELYQKSLSIRRNVFGDEHSKVGDTYYNMALVLKNQGKLDEAMELYQKSLAICRKVFGDEHSKVAACYNNMAVVLDNQGKLDEAMEFYQKALSIRRNVFGDEHSKVGDTYYNMASVYEKQVGKLEQALQMYQSAADVYENALGREDPEWIDANSQVLRVAQLIEYSGSDDEY